MSPLRLSGSTSGYSQLDAPAIAGDQTFTLPGTGGTIDRLNRAGNILQVVQGTTTTTVSVTSTTYTDTGLSASITPTFASSKVLVLIAQHFGADRGSSDAGCSLILLRGSTTIFSASPYQTYIAAGGATSIDHQMMQPLVYLDSPSTTSSITYKTQLSPYQVTSGGRARAQINSQMSMIVLLEVAA